MNRKGLEEKRNDLKSQMSSLLETAKAEERAMNEEEVAKFDEIEKEIKNIDATIEREEKVESMEEREVKVEERELTVEERDSKVFVDYIRGALENRAEANLTAGNNGAIIPTTIAQKVIAKAYDMSSVLKDATKYNTKGKISIPVYGADGSNDIAMAYADEFVELEGKVGKFTSVDLGNYLAGALAKVSKSLVANTDIDLENKVIELMAEAVARFEEKEVLVGTDGKVEGLKGVQLQVVAGSNSVLTAEDLIKAKNKVKKGFRKNAKWIMSNDTLTAIELLKDGEDRFIFRADLNGEFDGYILGYPVEVSDNMPEIGAGKDVIYFGDYSGIALKQRNDALELNVLREKFATQHAIGINAWVEFDAKVENAQKIAKITMGA
jgi:HK97 family phage major capsid protein